MKPSPMNKIFYEKSLRKENKIELKYLWTTILFVALLACFIVLFKLYVPGRWEEEVCVKPAPRQWTPFPLIPAGLQDVHKFLQESEEELCKNWEVIPSGSVDPGDNIQEKWRLGTSICMDLLPRPSTPSSCRIHSIRYDEDDIAFEMAKGKKDGCRVHLWGNKTTYNYSKLAKNVYLYPLDIGTSSGPGVYSFDDFLGMLWHDNLEIHYVKATLPGGYKHLLRGLYSSKSKVWQRIKQIQLIVHLPKVTPDTWRQLEEPYRDLVGLTYLGFELARARLDPRYVYTLPGPKESPPMTPEAEHSAMSFSTIYELVWIRTGEARSA